MKYIRKKLSLTDFGIAHVRPKRVIIGALIEIPGDDNEDRADRLCAAMSPLAEEKGAKVSRPIKTVELRVKSLDDSVSPEEVRDAVASAEGCRSTDIKVDQTRASPNGLLTAWVQCLVAAARRIVGDDAINVG
ncbi:uncharacterized protein LOC109860404 [Pseudomyrmex gracilis]|uniref:uncharacterized protein LOC109860404 n=1 Tax=Pseudomyrmex gracilis TaxID=219809 RepID=UPI000994B525|nr:uncharacterized protein LOC109860404 [Pseudomyrmex gracilis]